MTATSAPPAPGDARIPASATVLAAWLGLGALAVVLAVAPSPLFDLDRFAGPKGLGLNVTALCAAGRGAGRKDRVLTAPARGAAARPAAPGAGRAPLVATEVTLFAYAGW